MTTAIALGLNPDAVIAHLEGVHLSRWSRRLECLRARPTTSKSRRHQFKQAHVCFECITGKHLICKLGDCNCVHREEKI
jgi:hypothetical protein